jgi:hypothetical protein
MNDQPNPTSVFSAELKILANDVEAQAVVLNKILNEASGRLRDLATALDQEKKTVANLRRTIDQRDATIAEQVAEISRWREASIRMREAMDGASAESAKIRSVVENSITYLRGPIGRDFPGRVVPTVADDLEAAINPPAPAGHPPQPDLDWDPHAPATGQGETAP